VPERPIDKSDKNVTNRSLALVLCS